MAASKPPTDRVSNLLKERVRRVFRELPGALAGDEEPVHQVRVAGRRLRVALPLLARKARGGRLRRATRALRDLTRAAGAGRDLDVLVELFEDRLQTLDPPSPAQREILRRLRAARTRSRRRMAAEVLEVDVHRLRRDLRAIRSRRAADIFTVLARVRAVREKEGGTLQQGLAAVGDRYDPEALHSLRRRIRRLRYTAEVDDAIRGRDSGAGPSWKGLQEAIGALHDVHLLSGWLTELAERAQAGGRRALADTARLEAEAFAAEGRRLHEELLRTHPSDIVAQALEAMSRGRPAA